MTPYGQVTIHSGALFVLQPWVWHGYFDCESLLVNVCAIDTRVFDCELVWLRDNPAFSSLLWDQAITPQHDAPVKYLTAQQITRCSKSFFMLQEIESKNTLQARVQQIGRLTTFLADIAECVSANVALSGQDRKITPRSTPVEKTLLLFSENLARDWSISELSASLGLNTSYYIRVFKHEMGESPLSYLSGLRARRASQLLLKSECSVTQVGEEVGWADLGYFSRRFRHYFGISPREYRRKYRDFSYTS
jgi:AraC-like DNA-binding protein